MPHVAHCAWEHRACLLCGDTQAGVSPGDQRPSSPLPCAGTPPSLGLLISREILSCEGGFDFRKQSKVLWSKI